MLVLGGISFGNTSGLFEISSLSSPIEQYFKGIVFRIFIVETAIVSSPTTKQNLRIADSGEIKSEMQVAQNGPAYMILFLLYISQMNLRNVNPLSG